MEIKDKNGNVYNFEFAHYGESRNIEATDEEKMIAGHILALCPSSELVRLSDAYLTIRTGLTDVVRFKYTERAKWLMFPYLEDKSKRRFASLDDLGGFDDVIAESYNKACYINSLGTK